MGIQADYNPTVIPPPGGKPTPDQAKYALLTWADQSDQHAEKRRAHYGKIALVAGASVIALSTMLPRRTSGSKQSDAPASAGPGLLSLAGLIGLAKSAVALAPTAMRAHAVYQQFQQQRAAPPASSPETR
ncbi:MAG TPA: hypothetical protein PKB10_13750 [Tepidisphaeraceae bacterium]|nr:hypothetical protein [Tepidisphaeraceae bacterium]